MSQQSSKAAARLQAASETVRTLTRLCLHHPDLRSSLRAASLDVRTALLDLQEALSPALPPQPSPRPRHALRDPAPAAEQGTLAKALLLEIILRAASDWVLYRAHHRMMYREYASSAFTWLFEEGPQHPHWRERTGSGKRLTSFISICEVLDFDPELVRQHIRNLTPQRIVSMGRPAEYRRKRAPVVEYADTSDVKHFFSDSGLM